MNIEQVKTFIFQKKEQLLLIFISTLILSGVYLLLHYTERLLSMYIDEGYILEMFYYQGEEDDLYYRSIIPKEEGVYLFTTTVYREDIQHLSLGGGRLIIYRLAGQWYKVYWNDILIGSMGNLEDDRSNIWNAYASFDVDETLIYEENRVTIEIYSTFELGLLAFPPLFLHTKGATHLSGWFYFVLNRLHHIALGFMISSFSLLIFIQVLSKKIQGEYLFYSLSALFMSIASFDFLVFHTLSVDLFTFKRLTLFCLYFSISSISFGVGIQFKRRKNLILGSIAMVSILLLILLSPDLNTFRQGFSILNGLILLNILGWIYTSYTFFGVNHYANILLFSSMIVFILSAYDIYHIFSGSYSLFSLTIMGALLFSMIIILLVVLYYLELQKKMAYESQRASLMYQKSVQDSMTGLYNHQFIVNTLQELKTLYSLIIIDIDDFKPINDTYGHQAGDIVIKEVAKRGLATIRKTDMMGRYGGDEFVIILLECDEENALQIAQKCKERMEEPIQITVDDSLCISLSMGICTSRGSRGEEVLQMADRALYHSKRLKKGLIVPFSSINEK